MERTHMSVDTEQSAMQWRRAFEGALFRHAHSLWKAQHAKKVGAEPSKSLDDQWTMMRACVPLDRIRVSGMQDYHSFVTLLGLEIDLTDVSKVDFSPENELVTDHEKHEAYQKATGGDHRKLQEAHTEIGVGASGIRSPPISPPAAEVGGIFPCKRTSSLMNRNASSSSTPTPGRSSPSRQPSAMSTNTVDSARTGVDTPTKRFSLRNTLEKVMSPISPSHSRDPSPPRSTTTGPQWLDSTIPAPLAKVSGSSTGKPEDWNEAGPELEYSFNIAVQQEQTWFVGSLQTAVAEAKQRRYKAGVKRPNMVLNVAGYDCLVTDEDLDHTIETHDTTSDDSGDENAAPEEMGDGPDAERPSMIKVKAARKAEKASMAAKIFGLNEEDGIWRKST
jgi:sterol 3beta-glucosyltransferase